MVDDLNWRYVTDLSEVSGYNDLSRPDQRLATQTLRAMRARIVGESEGKILVQPSIDVPIPNIRGISGVLGKIGVDIASRLLVDANGIAIEPRTYEELQTEQNSHDEAQQRRVDFNDYLKGSREFGDLYNDLFGLR